MIERCLGHARGGATWFRRARSRSTRISRSLWAPVARRCAAMKTARTARVVAGGALALSASRAGAPARQLHDQPLQPGRGLRADRLYVRYVLDLAEIPTFQARPRSTRRRTRGGSPRGRAPRRVDGRAARARSRAHHALAHPRGAGGLRTTRLEIVLAGPRSPGRAGSRYRDGNYARPDRLEGDRRRRGRRRAGAHELRAYPKDLLAEPARRRRRDRRRSSPATGPTSRLRSSRGTAPPGARPRRRRRLREPDRPRRT